MLKLCAIDPDVMGEWRWFNFLEPHFGIAVGRLIAEYPKTWRRKVMERADDLVRLEVNTPIQRSRMEVRMSEDVFKRKLYSAGFPTDPTMTWEANARQQAFALVVVGGAVKGTSSCGVEALEFCPGGVETVRQMDVLKSHEETFKCAQLLLAKARKITLVDPNFNLNNVANRWTNVVRTLLGLVSQLAPDRQHDCIVEIHTERKHDYNRDLQVSYWRTQFRDSHCGKVKLRCIYWDKLPQNQVMHPRYLLTDQGGLHYDKGFDTEPGIKQQVTLLDDAYWVSLSSIYSADKLPEKDRAKYLLEA